MSLYLSVYKYSKSMDIIKKTIDECEYRKALLGYGYEPYVVKSIFWKKDHEYEIRLEKKDDR